MNVIKAKPIVELIKKDIQQLKSKIITKNPCAAIVRVGDHGDDVAYERSIVKKFNELDIATKLVTFDLNVDNETLMKAIRELNNDENVNGIIVLRPLPNHLDDDMIAEALDYKKDIDGLSHTNIARVFTKDNLGIVPCTAQAVMEILDYVKIDLCGLNVTIVGAGMAVGRPLTILMLNKRATVTVCRSLTQDLVQECKKADIVIAAAGVKHLINHRHIKPGAIVIDVGINVENAKIYGDVDFKDVKPLTKYITPVPNGVGSITTYTLAKQLFKCIELQEKSQ